MTRIAKRWYAKETLMPKKEESRRMRPDQDAVRWTASQKGEHREESVSGLGEGA